MKLPFRHPRSILIISALLWAGGVAFIWWFIPVGPRDGWQPPKNEEVRGFFRDGRILVTVPDRTVGTPKTGPVRLWDIETGNLLASHFGREDLFHVVFVFEELGLLQIQQRKGARDNHNFRLRMVDPWTGEDVASFACHVP